MSSLRARTLCLTVLLWVIDIGLVEGVAAQTSEAAECEAPADSDGTKRELTELDARRAQLVALRAQHGLRGPTTLLIAGLGASAGALLASAVIDSNRPSQLAPVAMVGASGVVAAGSGLVWLLRELSLREPYDLELRTLARRRTALNIKLELSANGQCASDAAVLDAARLEVDQLELKLQMLRAERDQIHSRLPLALAIVGIAGGTGVSFLSWLVKIDVEYPEDDPARIKAAERGIIAGGVLVAAGLGSLAWRIVNQRKVRDIRERARPSRVRLRELRALPLLSRDVTGVGLHLTF